MNDPAQYQAQHKNALKIGFLSPLFGATSFSFEHSLRPVPVSRAHWGSLDLERI